MGNSTRKYCGRWFSDQDIAEIKLIRSQDPQINRERLAKVVCERLDWSNANGSLKHMSCKVAMIRMERDGLISLPKPTTRNGRQGSRIKLTATTEQQPPKEVRPRSISGVELVTKGTSRLWNEYIQRYHYLGFKTLPGAQLRYFARDEDGEVCALLGYGAAAWMCMPRDQYIGWSADKRQTNLHLVVNNARFLILPWLSGKGLASRVLALAARRIARDWYERYGYRPVLLETFVEERFAGISYKAAGWRMLGKTKGRGKLGDHQAKLPIKSVWVYPLCKRFREKLGTSQKAKVFENL